MLCPVVLLVVAVGPDVVTTTFATNREGPAPWGGAEGVDAASSKRKHSRAWPKPLMPALLGISSL